MQRRTVLTLTTLGALSGTGCLAPLGDSCPVPSIENERPYERREPAATILESGDQGVFLVTEPDEVDDVDSADLEDEDERWVKETDFEESVVVGTQVASSGESSPLRVLGVGRASGDTIHAYTCIEDPGLNDDWYPYMSLLRVHHDETVPETAKLTHWEGGDERKFG